MNLKKIITRQMVVAMVAPIARALLSAVVGYLIAFDVPAAMVDQFAVWIASGGLIIFNVAWELIDRQKSSNRAVSSAIAQIMHPDGGKS